MLGFQPFEFGGGAAAYSYAYAGYSATYRSYLRSRSAARYQEVISRPHGIPATADPLGLGMEFGYHPRTAVRGAMHDLNTHYQQILSPRAYARAAGYARMFQHGFMQGFGFEWVPDTPGGAELFSELRGKGARGLHEYYSSKVAGKGSWRFLGLRGKGGRIEQFYADIAKGHGVGRAAWKAAPLASMMAVYFTGQAMMEGYRKDGIIGAAKAGVRSGLEWAAYDMAFNIVASNLGLVAVAAGIYGTYKALDYGAKHARKSRALEFGGQAVEDQFGTIATMRQRSLLEMQQSHAALRGALGSEAQYMHIA